MATKAEQVFADALTKVESASIRAWATSDHNRPHWLRFVEENLEVKGSVVEDPANLAGYIVGTAIGLFP